MNLCSVSVLNFLKKFLQKLYFVIYYIQQISPTEQNNGNPPLLPNFVKLNFKKQLSESSTLATINRMDIVLCCS